MTLSQMKIRLQKLERAVGRLRDRGRLPAGLAGAAHQPPRGAEQQHRGDGG